MGGRGEGGTCAGSAANQVPGLLPPETPAGYESHLPAGYEIPAEIRNPGVVRDPSPKILVVEVVSPFFSSASISSPPFRAVLFPRGSTSACQIPVRKRSNSASCTSAPSAPFRPQFRATLKVRYFRLSLIDVRNLRAFPMRRALSVHRFVRVRRVTNPHIRRLQGLIIRQQPP